MDDRGDRRVVRPTAARRAEIVAAALAILRSDGAAGLTARGVAARAGMALGQVTYHFRSMDELLVETHRAASAGLAAATAAAVADAGGSAADRLHAFLRAGFRPEFLTPDYLRLRLELWTAARHHPDLAATETALYAGYRVEMEAHLAALAAEAGGPSAAVPGVADALMALLDGLWLDALRRGPAAGVRAGLEAAMDLARLRLAPGSGLV